MWGILNDLPLMKIRSARSNTFNNAHNELSWMRYLNILQQLLGMVFISFCEKCLTLNFHINELHLLDKSTFTFKWLCKHFEIVHVAFILVFWYYKNRKCLQDWIKLFNDLFLNIHFVLKTSSKLSWCDQIVIFILS